MTIWARVRRVVFGPPKDVHEPHAFHKLSLIAFLAWVGLGADGLSSCAYGPEEAFRRSASTATSRCSWRRDDRDRVHHLFRLQPHHRAVSRRAAAATWSPRKLLGGRAGVVSGSALLVDYVLTITISIAAGRGRDLQLPAAALAQLRAGGLAMRRHRRSLTDDEPARRQGIGHGARADLPGVFLVTHAIAHPGSRSAAHVPELPAVTAEVHANVGGTLVALGDVRRR